MISAFAPGHTSLSENDLFSDAFIKESKSGLFPPTYRPVFMWPKSTWKIIRRTESRYRKGSRRSTLKSDCPLMAQGCLWEEKVRIHVCECVLCVHTQKNQTLIGRSLALTLGCEGRCTCCFGSCLCLCCVEWPWWELTLIRQRGN